MADGVAITAGSGTTILTDDTGAGGHAQVVKLAISTDGSGTLIPADGTNGITVNLGTNNDVTVTGTVAVTQSGTWDEVGINDSGNSITVDNGGTFAVQVDGAALTSLQLIDDAVYASDAALNKTMAIGAVLDDTATVAITENQAGYLRMSSRRALLVEGVASGTAQNVLDTNSAAVLTAVQKIDDPVIVDDAAFTPATSSLMMGGFFADETATDSVDEGDAGVARITLDRKQIVTLYPHTAGGLLTKNSTSSDGGTALTSTAQEIKASAAAGQLYGYYIFNANAVTSYVQFYNTAVGSVTVGTTNPLFMLAIPAYAAANLMFPYGVAFGTAMSWAATNSAGGNTAPSTALDAVCWYA